MMSSASKPQDLAGKVALAAGAGGAGMGRASALELAAAGAHVVVLDLNVDAANETLALIESAGGQGEAVRLDMTDGAAVAASYEGIFARHGRLDILFNNTGVAPVPGMRLIDYDPETWDRYIRLNLNTTWLSLRYAIPLMIKAGRGGAIVNNASVSGLRANISGAPYAVAKAGVIHLTKIAALEYGAQGVRVNAIAPYSISRRDFQRPDASDAVFLPEDGALEDPRWFAAQLPMLRSGKGYEVAAAVRFLVSDQASWISGAVLPVDGASSAGYFGRVR